MCRLLAMVGAGNAQYISFLDKMSAGQEDGTGYAYLLNGEIGVVKSGSKFQDLVKTNFFDLLTGDNGWSICHMRKATTGKSRTENAHPFQFGNYVTAHNGMWSGHSDYREVCQAFGIQYQGDTDSEVAASLISQMTPKKFYEAIGKGGIYLSLDKTTGDLWVLVAGYGNIYEASVDGMKVISTDDVTGKGKRLSDGWYQYNSKGELVNKETKYAATTSYKYGSGYSSYGTYTGSSPQKCAVCGNSYYYLYDGLCWTCKDKKDNPQSTGWKSSWAQEHLSTKFITQGDLPLEHTSHGLRVGSSVETKRFGTGKVVALKGDRVEVKFGKNDTKTFMLDIFKDIARVVH